MANKIDSKVWVCGDRTPRYIVVNPYYYVFDPFMTIEDMENISNLNKYWSEYVCQYYVFRNKFSSDIVTMCHDVRIVKYTKIDHERIINDNAFQYYYEWIDHRQKRHDNLGNLYVAPENVPDRNYLNIYHELVTKMGQPMFMYNDFIEFLNKQSYVSQEDIVRIATEEPNVFITRECYSCSWDIFVMLQQYLLEYFEFVQNKYDLNKDPKRHAEFFLTTIVPHYVDAYKKANGRLSYSRVLYQPQSMFDTIFDKTVNYGVDCRNNVYRLFSYNVELLISIFIKSRNHFMIPDSILSSDS